MRIITLIAEKGGVGKTTIALELAVAAVKASHKVAVIDVDPQATASQWGDRRQSEYPWIVATHAIRMDATLQKARSQNVEYVFVDTPPHSGSDVVQAASRSHLVLLPVESHLFSLETIQKQNALLVAAGKPSSCYVINKAPVKGHDADGAFNFLMEQGSHVCPQFLHLRAVYRHASNLGRGTMEYSPKSVAAEEVANLYQYMLTLVNH